MADRRAAHLTTLAPDMRDELIRRGVPPSNFSVIYHWSDEANMHPAVYDADLAARLGLKDRFVVLFAGTMSVMKESDVVLADAALFAQSSTEVHFVLGEPRGPDRSGEPSRSQEIRMNCGAEGFGQVAEALVAA